MLGSSFWQRLLHQYTHGRYHCYQYIWIPCSLNFYCYSLVLGSTYKPHRWEINHWNRFIWIHVLFCKYNQWLVVRSLFTISECAAKEIYVDELSTSLFLHDSVALFYRDSISHSQIILAGQFHITNLYCNSLDHHLCTTWGSLASDSKIFEVHCNLKVT